MEKLQLAKKRRTEAENPRMDPLMRALKALHSAGSPENMTPEELERKLTLLNDALEKTMRTEDISCIREVLHRVVPTFHEPEEVNRTQGEEVEAPAPAVS